MKIFGTEPGPVGVKPATYRLDHCMGRVVILKGRSGQHVGRDSVVSIATRYRLDGPGIESRWWRGFLHRSRPALGPTQHPIQWVLCLSWG